MRLDLNYIPEEQQSGKTEPALAAVPVLPTQSDQGIVVPLARFCTDSGHPKNGKRINLGRLASTCKQSLSTLEAQGTCESHKGLSDLQEGEKPCRAFLSPNNSGSEQRGLAPSFSFSSWARLKWRGCKTQVVLCDVSFSEQKPHNEAFNGCCKQINVSSYTSEMKEAEGTMKVFNVQINYSCCGNSDVWSI